MKALVAAGGQELLILTPDDGRTCLDHALESSHENGHSEVVTALLVSGQQQLSLLAERDGPSSLVAALPG